jgi:hypothetical protein
MQELAKNNTNPSAASGLLGSSAFHLKTSIMWTKLTLYPKVSVRVVSYWSSVTTGGNLN